MLAIHLLLGTAPMVLAALVKKFLRYFTKPPQPIILPELQPQSESQFGNVNSGIPLRARLRPSLSNAGVVSGFPTPRGSRSGV